MASGLRTQSCLGQTLAYISVMETDPTQPRNIGRAVLLAILCTTVGALSAEATVPEVKGWYAGLTKPWFNPPNWVFGPVWFMIYVWMAIAASATWDNRAARRTFFIILPVNLLWSLLFFGLHRPDLALIDILAYLILLVIWIRQLWPFHRDYAKLQVIHLLWVNFATVLNASIWWLNK